MKKKRPFTLLEIMIAIFLIGLIGSIIGFNMRGSLEEGKAFKTRQAIERLSDILELEIAYGRAALTDVKERTEAILERSGLVKNPRNFLKDGWGNPLTIEVDEEGQLSITSEKLVAYDLKKEATLEASNASQTTK